MYEEFFLCNAGLIFFHNFAFNELLHTSSLFFFFNLFQFITVSYVLVNDKVVDCYFMIVGKI